MRIVYNIEAKDYSPRAVFLWEQAGYVYKKGNWDRFAELQNLAEVEILIVRLGSMVSRDVLSTFTNLKFLISATTGHNHLDKEALEERGVKLISLRGQEDFLRTIPSTAEFTWGLIINLLRNIPAALTHVENGSWDRELFKGYQLYGMNIGLIGLGRIGCIVAKYANAFGMNVFYVDPAVNNLKYNRLKSLNDLASKVDILSIHVHSDPLNYNLINSDIISRMKKGSYLVNTSRGEVWDEQAVVDAIHTGKLSGVGADVVKNETKDMKESPLWSARRHENILLTPHIGGASYNAMWQCEEFTQKLLFDQC
jgi:D-3-phosphoglycerate dehydrogenase